MRSKTDTQKSILVRSRNVRKKRVLDKYHAIAVFFVVNVNNLGSFSACSTFLCSNLSKHFWLITSIIGFAISFSLLE